MRHQFVLWSVVMTCFVALAGYFHAGFLWLYVVVVPTIVVGYWDMFQTRHTIRRNFPVLGHFRYLLESIRPEINQYFIESNSDGVPFNRETRSIVYQRAKKQMDTLPFGTQLDVYDVGYEWVNHSLQPCHVSADAMRVSVGGPLCSQPYDASIFNISAMSYGSLSKNAILALNAGAKLGNFAHDTGEGGITPYHLEPGGDLIWEIGTAYFGCRDDHGHFDKNRYREKAKIANVKMIEIKLSQGAKPAHGGILPAAKLTKEIAEIRGVPMGRDVISPPAHSAFSNPIKMMEFIQLLRDESGGKPVGFKLCVGKRREFLAICKAMRATKIYPDFITVDGGEGGTGAAPLEFSNSVGMPLREGLIFVRNALVGFDVKKHIKILCSGKAVTGFDIIARLAMGADMVNSARAMMMALGCIQALRCNSNLCPTGVATQNPTLVKGLVVEDKKYRVANYHAETVKSAAEILGAMGVDSPSRIHPWHLMKRISLTTAEHYGDLYEFLEQGVLLEKSVPPSFKIAMDDARAEVF